jgi:hypothetical protein
MESKIEKIVTLKLNEQEAKWLKLLIVLSRKEAVVCVQAEIRKEKVENFSEDHSSKILLFTEPDGSDIVDNFLHALREIDIPISEGA